MEKTIYDGNYDFTTGTYKNTYVRPYNQIGRENEAKERDGCDDSVDKTQVKCENGIHTGAIKSDCEEKGAQKKAIENLLDDAKEKEYVSTLGVMNNIWVRPYNTIGYNNDACQGKSRDDDMEK